MREQSLMTRQVDELGELGIDLRSRFAPIFALKSASDLPNPRSKRLKARQQKKAREALRVSVPMVLAHCSGIDTHPDNDSFANDIVLWDFLNGREIRLGANERGGYDLRIHGAEICWTETQLTLDLLLLKLLALDYTPEEFRAFAG